MARTKAPPPRARRTTAARRSSLSTPSARSSLPESTEAREILPDVLAPGLDVVFCGSAPGRVSALRGAYFAGPGNRFWPMLAETGLTPRRLAPEEYPLLPQFGLGLTDLCKTASGADRDLPATGDDREGLAARIALYQPRLLAFVGRRPAKVFLERQRVLPGLQAERIGATGIFVLPSPSGLARGHWDPAPWHALAALARAGS